MVIEQIEASCICPEDPCVPPDYCARPPNDRELRRCRRDTIECCSRHGALDEDERRMLEEDERDQAAEQQPEGGAVGSAEDDQGHAADVDESGAPRTSGGRQRTRRGASARQ
jgi:hypothetical protein